MNELSDPTIPIKKRRKLIKKVYEIVEDEVRELIPLIKKSSPISAYWETEQKVDDLAVIDAVKTTESRYRDRTDWITKNPYRWDMQYVNYMTDFLKVDKAFNRGVDNAFEKRYDASGYIKVLLTCVNIRARINWIKFVSENDFFTPETLTRMKIILYSMSDALKSDDGKELTELCIDTDIEDVSCLLDEKLREYSNIRTDNLCDHFNGNELKKLRELLNKGEPFYVYRGFLIKGDERVRKGKKSDPDTAKDYYKQDAGIGISYSLSFSVAAYFCFFNLSHTRDGVDRKRKTNWLDSIPPYLQNKDEWIEQMTKNISNFRDKPDEETGEIQRPVICKYLIDPEKIKGFSMDTSEDEIMIKPEDTSVENYVLASSKQIAEGMYGWKMKQISTWEDCEGAFNENGYVVLQLPTHDGGKNFIFADGKKVNETIKQMKIDVRDKGKPFDMKLMIDTFKENAIDIPRNVVEINPFRVSKNMFDLMTNRYGFDVKSRRGRVYTWSGKAIETIRDIMNKV